MVLKTIPEAALPKSPQEHQDATMNQVVHVYSGPLGHSLEVHGLFWVLRVTLLQVLGLCVYSLMTE